MTIQTEIKEIVTRIAETPDCVVETARGLPHLHEGHVLPEDVEAFYELCGGASLYRSSSYTANIVGPEAFQLANPIIVGVNGEVDISSAWYVIADDGYGEYLTIDCSLQRLGRCYDSFSDRHGVRGSCPIIAVSFMDLLSRLLQNRGEHWYWLQAGFDSLGDAYD
jgi:antitoxin YokJ